MKIAMIAPSEIPALRANTLQVMKMAQAFCELGQQVTLLAPALPGSAALSANHKPTWNELAHHYGLSTQFPLEWLPARPTLRRYDFAINAVRRARALHADLIYTRLPQTAAIASWMGIPTCLEIHDFPQGQTGPLLFQIFLSGRGARRLVIITHALASDLDARFSTLHDNPLMRIAPDGVDPSRYQNLPSPAEARQQLAAAAPAENGQTSGLMGLSELTADRFTVGYTGHLYPGRGAEILIELAAHLPEFAFLVAGGDPKDVSRMQQTALNRELANIVFSGFVPNAELPRYQAACEVLLMPYQEHVSASSGGDIARYLSPMKLFEYLACSRAIVSSDLPVLREALNENNSILLPPRNIAAWVNALQILQQNPNLRDRLAAQAGKDAQQYTWQARAARILEGIS